MLAAIIVCTGCGGSSSKPSSPAPTPTPTPTPTPAATKVTVTFQVASPSTAETSIAGTVLPKAVATQIGTGAWTAATLDGGTLTVTIPSGTSNYAVAFNCPAFSYNGFALTSYEQVTEATVEDGSAYTMYCPSYTTAGYTTVPVPVDASAISGTKNLYLVDGGVGMQLLPGSSGTFQARMANGASDVAASALDGNYFPLAIHILRSQNIPGYVNGGNPITLTASDLVTKQSMGATGVPAGFLPTAYLNGFYVTSGNTGINLNQGEAGTQYATIPAGQTQTGDYYSVQAEAYSQPGSPQQTVKATQNSTTMPGSVMLTLPAPLTFNAPVAAAFPSLTVGYSGFSSSQHVTTSAQIYWYPTANTESDLQVYATAAYLNGATTLAIPDLTSLPGFLGPAASGTTVNWVSEAIAGTYFSYEPVPLNSTQLVASTQGTYTEP